MLVPVSWLQEFAPVQLSAQQLADVFNSLGLVVEGIVTHGANLDGIVVAEVRAIRAHPNADKIRLVDVATSETQTETLQVACGAWNFHEGDRVPFATLGTTMPSGMSIERRKMRGEWSNGMLCSAHELELSDDHEGILVLEPGTPLGTPIAKVLGITNDVVFDLAVEANRPDAMSIAGIARDVAAKSGVAFSLPAVPSQFFDRPGAEGGPPGSITAAELCDRLTLTVIRNVHVTDSPAWMQTRLTLAGMRPINNLVDASNYVMLEIGAPSHAFDLTKLAKGRIGVRWAAPGETIETLDGNTRTLSVEGTTDGVIVDGVDAAIGIAGVMGGASTEVDASTTALILEIAHWTPMAIARTSKRLGLRSEASARYERNADPEVLERAASRFIEVLRNTCPNLVFESFDDVRPGGRPLPRAIRLRTDRVNLILGTGLADAQITAYLTGIGFGCSPAGDGLIDAVVPSWRTDVELEVNLIEEVGRLYGYDNIARITPANATVGGLTQYQKDRRLVRRSLTAQGIDEAWTATLLDDADLTRSGLAPTDAVGLANPMVSEESLLRTSLLPGLLRALRFNANHRNMSLRLFEIGHVFGTPRPEQVVPYEREHLSIVFGAEGDDARTAKQVLDILVGALRIKPVAVGVRAREDLAGLHPTRSAEVIATGVNMPVGFVGEVDPDVLTAWGIERRVGWLQVDLENLTNLPRRTMDAPEISKFPSSDFDLAFVVADTVAAEQLERAIRRAGKDLVADVRLFDVHRSERLGSGRRSLAFRLRANAADRTLTDADLAALRTSCIEAANKLGAELRS